jgi:hypothetical protein
MDDSNVDCGRRIEVYLNCNAISLAREVGFGVHGRVVETTRKSAIKAFEAESNYCRERNVYLRLRRLGVWAIGECQVPRLVDFDDELWVIEMTLVSPPFVLDFGGAYLDQRPDYSAETLAEWEAERSELFGDDWPRVQAIRAALAGFGIYYYDAHPGNIRFR